MGESNQFICLAEYWCPCVPVGKPVSERTMDRHRKSINSRRSSLGLPVLPRGPRHTAERETQEFSRRISMSTSQNPFSQLFSLNEITASTVGFGNLPGHSQAHDSNISNPETHHATGSDPMQLVDDSAQIESLPTNSQHPSNEATFGATDDLTSDGSEQLDVDLTVETDSGATVDDACSSQSALDSESNSSHENSSMERSDESVLDGESSGGHVGRSHALLRFKSWASKEKEWVEMFVEFGVTNRLMTRILKLKKAPLTPITLKRNLIKYSGFETTLYFSCLGHMLIDKLTDEFDLNDAESDFSCSVCAERGTVPKFSTFEYLKILPRLRSWVQNEDSCRLLFEYRHEQIRERTTTTEHGFGPGNFYSDIIDGELFHRIADKSGGLLSMEYDILLSVSCDGFQTYSNNSYDCWPIVALNHNLHPSMRFLIDNLIPLGFIKGPREPVRLDTFLIPLLEEVLEINDNGGTVMTFFDGIERTVRVHVVMVTGDTPAVSKLAGISGSNGKCSCRLCEHEGVYCSGSRHYYFPSKVRVFEDGRIRQSWKYVYDIENPDMRSAESVEATLCSLDDQSLTRAQRERIQRDTGVKKRTVTLRFPTIFAYASFPLDTMHLIMNVSKDMVELLRGENRVISRATSGTEEFIISENGLRMIDAEIGTIANGSAAGAFGNAPRVTSEYKKWKAVECKDFFKWYAVVLLEGHVSSTTLKGISLLSAIFERCTWPTLSQDDVDGLKSLCVDFVQHFECHYFRYDLERVAVCKSTIHAILHLARTVELCGPLVNVNQFWVERYIGAIKHRFHAKRLAAEALTENAKVVEAYKMYYKQHFRVVEDSIENPGNHRGVCISGVILLTPVEQEVLHDPFHVRRRTKALLEDFILRLEGMSEAEAKLIVAGVSLWSHGRVELRASGNVVIFGAMSAKRHRKNMTRADYFVSCEFLGSGENQFDVYYGRLLKIMHLRYELDGEIRDIPVVLIDWAQRLRRTALGQVYKSCRLKQAFGAPSIEHASILSGSIAVLEHRIPGSTASRTYFIDPARESNYLLDPDRASPDGKKRTLKGLQ